MQKNSQKCLTKGKVLTIDPRGLPVLASFPPATLSVITAPSQSTPSASVPYPALGPNFYDTYLSVHEQMDAVMPQLVSAIAALGIYQPPQRPFLNGNFSQILNAANYSYTLDLAMPRLKCTSREASTLDESIFQPLFNTWNGTDPFNALCTTPSVTFASNQSFDANCSADSNPAIQLQQQPGLYLAYALTKNGTVVTDGDGLEDPTNQNSSVSSFTTILSSQAERYSISDCGVYNATTHLNVTSANGDITIDVLKTDFTNHTIDFFSSDAPSSGVYWLKGILDVVLGYRVQFNTSTAGEEQGDCWPKFSGNVFGTVLAGSRDFRAALNTLKNGRRCGEDLTLPMTSSNLTLAEMIEDLSLNASLSWMSMEDKL
jgi:hypothetical protein